MAVDTRGIRQALRDFDFRNLLIEELGWDRPPSSTSLRVNADGSEFVLRPVAQKRVMTVYVCESETDDAIPPRATRQKIERLTAKLAHEHVIIFVDHDRTTQIWQWAGREPGRS